MRNMYQNMGNSQPNQPVNNIITTNQTQTPQKELVEWRILNENEQVDNLYVDNKTLFISDKNMVLKGADGKLEKWEIKKIYPIDEKELRIQELENEVNELKGMIANEHPELNKSIENVEQSTTIDNVDVKSSTKTSSSNVSRKK
jgi:hypothetical protein